MEDEFLAIFSKDYNKFSASFGKVLIAGKVTIGKNTKID